MQVHGEKASAAKILDAAARLFVEKGYANVSIRDVCKETGVTAPVIYYYFGNKRGLFEAVARKHISMTDFITKLTGGSDAGTPQKAVSGFVRAYLSSFPEHAFDPGLYMRDSADLDKQSAKMISGDLDKIHEVAAEMIKRFAKRREFHTTSPDLAADCLLGMLNRVTFQRIHFSKASDVESYGKFVTDFFLKALS